MAWSEWRKIGNPSLITLSFEIGSLNSCVYTSKYENNNCSKLSVNISDTSHAKVTIQGSNDDNNYATLVKSQNIVTDLDISQYKYIKITTEHNAGYGDKYTYTLSYS